MGGVFDLPTQITIKVVNSRSMLADACNARMGYVL